MAIGRERVHLTAGDLHRLSSVIRRELPMGNGDDLVAALRFFAQAIWLLAICAALALVAYAVTGPLFAYPWSN